MDWSSFPAAAASTSPQISPAQPPPRASPQLPLELPLSRRCPAVVPAGLTRRFVEDEAGVSVGARVGAPAADCAVATTDLCWACVNGRLIQEERRRRSICRLIIEDGRSWFHLGLPDAFLKMQ